MSLVLKIESVKSPPGCQWLRDTIRAGPRRRAAAQPLVGGHARWTLHSTRARSSTWTTPPPPSRSPRRCWKPPWTPTPASASTPVVPGTTCAWWLASSSRPPARSSTRFFGGAHPERLVFAYNATDALNLAIQGILESGDHVITTTIEHNSVIRPLNHMARERGVSVEYVPVGSDGFVDPAEITRRLRRTTKLVAVNHGSNVIGTIQPVAEIGRRVPGPRRAAPGGRVADRRSRPHRRGENGHRRARLHRPQVAARPDGHRRAVRAGRGGHPPHAVRRHRCELRESLPPRGVPLPSGGGHRQRARHRRPALRPGVHRQARHGEHLPPRDGAVRPAAGRARRHRMGSPCTARPAWRTGCPCSPSPWPGATRPMSA